MKLIIDQAPEYEELEISIKCSRIDKRLEDLIGQIRLYSSAITGKKDKYTYNIDLEEVCYFESVDDKTFIYLNDQVYESELRIYELEEHLKDTKFIRISKSSVLNIDKLSRVRALINGKYEAQLKNGEKLIITRHYVPDFKKKFGL